MNYIIIVKVQCSVNIWKLYLVISLPVPFKNCVHAKWEVFCNNYCVAQYIYSSIMDLYMVLLVIINDSVLAD